MRHCKILSFGIVCLLLTAACNYKTVTDAVYPEQKVYIAAAASGTVYTIESIPVHSSNTPTPGTPFRFEVDPENNLFNIPLSVYRSGIDNGGSVRVDIIPDNDTVNKLIAAGSLDGVALLPAGNFEIPSSVTIADGHSYGSFNVPVKLDYLLSNAPAGKFAFGLGIACSSSECSKGLDALVVVIDTKIMIPTANFSFQADVNTWNRITFNNTSSNILSSKWDFGDGTTSVEANPSHLYQEGGFYDVTLTTTGVSGEQETKTLNIPVIRIVKIDKSDWQIVDFSTEEPAEGNGNGYAAAVIDDNINTFWHSQWSGGSPGYPHHVTVDMGAEYTVANFQCVRRQGDNRGQTECQIWTSLDNTTWENRGTFAVADSDAPQIYTMPNYDKVRYFRYAATKGGDYFAFLAEISAYGSQD